MTTIVLSAVTSLISAGIGYLLSWYRMRAQPFVSLLFTGIIMNGDEPFTLAKQDDSPGEPTQAALQKLSNLASDAWILPPADFANTQVRAVADLLQKCEAWEVYGRYLDERVEEWVDKLSSARDSKAIEDVLVQSLRQEHFSYLLSEAALRGKLNLEMPETSGDEKINVAYSNEFAERNGCFVFDFDDILIPFGIDLNISPFAEGRLTPLLHTISTLDRDKIIETYKQVPSLYWHQQNIVMHFKELIEESIKARRRWMVHFSIANLGQPMLVLKKATLIVDGGGISSTEFPCTIWDALKPEGEFEFLYRPSGGEAVLLQEGQIIHLAAVTHAFGEMNNTEALLGAFEAKPAPGSAKVRLRLKVRGPERLRPREAISSPIDFAAEGTQ